MDGFPVLAANHCPRGPCRWLSLQHAQPPIRVPGTLYNYFLSIKTESYLTLVRPPLKGSQGRSYKLSLCGVPN